MNERDFPHLVELELPPGGLPSQNLEFDAFHREHGIPIRRGRGRHEAEQFHVRFCFADAVTADAFHQRFGGTRLTYSPFKPGRLTGPRARYQPSYSPRVVDGKIRPLVAPRSPYYSPSLRIPWRDAGVRFAKS